MRHDLEILDDPHAVATRAADRVAPDGDPARDPSIPAGRVEAARSLMLADKDAAGP